MRTFLALCLLSASLAEAQPAQTLPPAGLTFIPGSLLFPSLAANYEEPRVGVRKEIGSSKLKLDIGSSLDLLEERLPGDGDRMRAGIDFFTYALTTSAEGLRLQVDAVNGYFGGHIVYVGSDEGKGVAFRLRLLHISSHLIDGHWDNAAQQWKNGKEPIPYTRNFGELLGAYSWTGTGLALRVYTGFSYATLVRPGDLARSATLHGIEVRTTGLVGEVFDRPCAFYVADHLTFSGIPTYYGTNNVEFGVKFGAWDGKGVRLYGSYYRGLDAFSQYYYVRGDQWGAGFALDCM